MPTQQELEAYSDALVFAILTTLPHVETDAQLQAVRNLRNLQAWLRDLHAQNEPSPRSQPTT